MSNRQYYVYVLTNGMHTVFYTGVTSDLRKRVSEHKQGTVDGASQRVDKLVYFESWDNLQQAMSRSKEIVSSSRQEKEKLITPKNKLWKDLHEGL
jgi:putative endonuclease